MKIKLAVALLVLNTVNVFAIGGDGTIGCPDPGNPQCPPNGSPGYGAEETCTTREHCAVAPHKDGTEDCDPVRTFTPDGTKTLSCTATDDHGDPVPGHVTYGVKKLKEKTRSAEYGTCKYTDNSGGCCKDTSDGKYCKVTTGSEEDKGDCTTETSKPCIPGSVA